MPAVQEEVMSGADQMAALERIEARLEREYRNILRYPQMVPARRRAEVEEEMAVIAQALDAARRRR